MSNRLPILAAEIKDAVADSQRHAGASLASAIKAGAALVEAKALVAHGQWLTWLRTNVDISERSAQVYMRLARHKHTVDTKSAATADLTIAAAVAELTEPKFPEVNDLLPAAGHIKIGLRKESYGWDKESYGWDEVWIAPSEQHPEFFYCTHIVTSIDPGTFGTWFKGIRKPIRADMVPALFKLPMADAQSIGCNPTKLEWREVPHPAWPCNILLFADKRPKADHLDIMLMAQPGYLDSDIQMKSCVREPSDPPRPLCADVFGLAP